MRPLGRCHSAGAKAEKSFDPACRLVRSMNLEDGLIGTQKDA